MSRPPYAYQRGYLSDGRGKKRTAPNDDPEHRFQCEVVTCLEWALPEDIVWTANAAGVRVGMQTATKMKAAGVRRGWTDLQFLFPSAVTRYLELKAGTKLRPDQEAFRDRCLSTGRDIWGCANELPGDGKFDEVEQILTRWRVPLKMPLRFANRYQAPMYTRGIVR